MSSGTTGTPKPIFQTFGGMDAQAHVVALHHALAGECSRIFCGMGLKSAWGFRSTIAALANICLAVGVAPLARVKSLADPDTPILLDNGVSGIIFPDINTPEEARRAVEICRFPPIGRRSVGANFPQFDARAVPANVSVPAINGSTVVVVMVETKRGLDNIEAIAKVPGVDVVHIGTNDLMADLGKAGQLDDPAVGAALDRAIAACKAAGNFAGCGGIRDTAKQAYWIRRGIRFLSTQTDIALLHAGAKAWIDGVHAAMAKG